MKLIILLSALTALASAEWALKKPEEVAEIRKKCIVESNVPQDIIEKLKKYEYPDVKSVHDQIECTMTKLEVYDKTNGYNIDRAIEQFADGKQEFKPVMENCIKDNGGTNVYGVWACLLKNGLLTQKVKEQAQIN